MFYSEFITHVMSKISNIECEYEDRKGIGFERDNPMGSVNNSQDYTSLNPSLANTIIPALEGNNGEVIVAHNSIKGRRGHLVRLGSISKIDIYETYIIDKEYNIKKIRIFFNGYMSMKIPQTIRVAEGFHINPINPQIKFLKII